MFEISKMAYDIYVQNWIDEHTTPELRLQNIRDYYCYVQECLIDGIEPDNYKNWLSDYGFNGSLCVCYEEFCDIEYHDKDYIKSLLGEDETFIEMYYRDIEDRLEKEALASDIKTVNKEIYEEALNDYFKLVRTVEEFKDSFEELCNNLCGLNYDGELFDVSYGVLSTTVKKDGEVYCVSSQSIDIWDDSMNSMLEENISIDKLKEICSSMDIDVNNNASLQDYIADATKRSGKNGNSETEKDEFLKE